VLHVREAVKQMAGLHAEFREHRMELPVELLLRLLVRRRVSKGELAVTVDGDPVLGSRQILGGEPEIYRVLRDPLQRPVRRELRLAWFLAAKHRLLRLAD